MRQECLVLLVDEPRSRARVDDPRALADERLRENPLVLADPRVRSSAAAPLVTRDGHHLGALCVYDTRPRRFEETDLANLTDLAGVIMRELELRLSSRRAVFNRD